MPRATAGSHIESESTAASLSLTTLPPYATFGSIELMLRCEEGTAVVSGDRPVAGGAVGVSASSLLPLWEKVAWAASGRRL